MKRLVNVYTAVALWAVVAAVMVACYPQSDNEILAYQHCGDIAKQGDVVYKEAMPVYGFLSATAGLSHAERQHYIAKFKGYVEQERFIANRAAACIRIADRKYHPQRNEQLQGASNGAVYPNGTETDTNVPEESGGTSDDDAASGGSDD